jgi:beta-lactam-binding protein with PASTA domain/tRNA A-37 threonylcarbamoyl transferase component Bud32
MTISSTDPLIGRLIDGRYQVRSRIARGGMATVYLATDLRLERRVAIKVMHGHLADDSKFKERFIQEARSAARLANPNVVNVFDQGQDSDMAYLVMEYLPGITLRDLLQEHGRLTTDQTLDILEAVLTGLAAAHKAGIVHRDLKPENVLLADDGRIKIGDFGLARAATANTATGAALLGTIAYLSPELVTRGVADARSDIYAVGIMTYEMLTGEQPFKGEQPMQIAYQHANDSVPTPSTKNPKVPVGLDELVLWATAREPDERPRDARAMLDEVMGMQSSLRTDPDTQSTATQRTVVFPGIPAGPGGTSGTEETQVLATPARRRTAPVAVVGNVGALGTKSKKRRARGWWLFALVIVLAAAAGGTGWYFGAGPGSRVTIEDVAGDTQPVATQKLVADGFVVATQTTTMTSPTIAKDLVANTTPAIGEQTSKGGTIVLRISSGPALLPIPNVVGQKTAAAKSLIRTAGFTVGKKTIEQFDAKIAKGIVLQALDQDGNDLAARNPPTYAEQRPITLVVSAGKLPDVAGLDQNVAIARLAKVGITAQPGQEAYSDTVDNGKVIGIDPQTTAAGVSRVFRVGDSNVLLITSRGPELVAVPKVEGESWAQAKPQLVAAGFQLNYDHRADGPGAIFIFVKSANPAGGSQAPKNSTITIKFN